MNKVKNTTIDEKNQVLKSFFEFFYSVVQTKVT